MILISKYLGLFLLSATKYFVAALLLLADKSISPIETFLILLIGGVLGILSFYFLGTIINILLDKFFLLWKKELVPKKRFTKINRWYIKIKTNYGLVGISVLAPIFFSIPIGCFLASRFYRNEKKTIPILLAGALFWTFIFTGIKIILL